MSLTLRLLRRPPGLSSFAHIRHASTAPKTLAKPTKFTPPSHPSTPRYRDPINYPGPPQPPRDPTRRYPHTMPPPNTLAHTLLTSRSLHFYISMGILFSLAATVSVRNFVKTSPFAKDVYWSWMHPVDSIGSFLIAVRLNAEEESRRVKEMRRKKVEDVELRGEYRKAHGIEEEGRFGGWMVKKSGREPVDPVGSPVAMAGSEKENWVEDQIQKAEEEAEALVVAAKAAAEKGDGQTVVAVIEEPAKEKKKGWW